MTGPKRSQPANGADTLATLARRESSRPNKVRLLDRSAAQLLILITLASALRVVWWLIGPRVIESEGAYYARVAQNLAAGRGLLDMSELGFNLIYPPLYEVLMAGGVRLGVPAELGGRVISLVFGALLPIGVYLFARRSYGPSAGWWAGLLAATNPVLIVASTAVLTESSYLSLLVLTLFCVADVLRLGSLKSALLGGLFTGISYLVRPEVMIITLALAAVALLTNRARWQRAVRHVGLLVGVLMLIAMPYVLFIYAQTGQVRFETKTADVLGYAIRQDAGQNWGQTLYGIDSNLDETGTAMISDAQLIATTRPPLSETVRVTAKSAVENVPRLVRGLGDMQLGAPFLAAVAALGLFGAAWTRDRLLNELPLMLVSGLALISYWTLPYSHDRFLYPLLPVLVIWGGVGLARLAAWAKETAQRVELPRATASGFAAVTPLVPVALIAAVSMIGVRTSDDLSQSFNSATMRDDVQAARWIQTQVAPGARVADTYDTVSYYSGSVLVQLPWTDGATALRYLDKKQVSFVILREADRGRRPYLADWLDRAPIDRLELLQTIEGRAGRTFVYHLRAQAGSAT